MRYRLRTLLILLAVMPLLLAWAWNKYEATRWRWYSFEGGGRAYLPPNTPGYHWEEHRRHRDGWSEVPNEKPSR